MKTSWFVVALFFLIISFVPDTGESKEPGAVKSIKSKDGEDTIDCIYIYQQPAFKNPLLRKHKIIEMYPGNLPSTKGANTAGAGVQQPWRKNGRCPNGTIPIRREKKQTQFMTEAQQSVSCRPEDCSMEFAGIQAPQTVYGARGYVNLWEVLVEPNEWSSSGITVSNGHGSFIQYGWMDQPSGVNCFNLRCPGFVQVSNEYALGAALEPLSTYGGAQYEIRLTMYKDTENWWVMYGNHILGYWAGEVLAYFKDARAAFWGGQICNMHQGLNFTTTRMGSGYYPVEGWGKSAYINGMEVMDADGAWKKPDRPFINSSIPNCYGVDTYRSKDGTLSAFFGGTANIECCGLGCQ